MAQSQSQFRPAFSPDSEFAELETPRGPRCGGGLSITALARFEFEAGKGNDGTKILMIEWEDDDLTRSAADGSWQVSWEGKTTVLPAQERPDETTRRFYFLLPPNVTIPPVVTLSFDPPHVDTCSPQPPQARESLQLNPLPAIFPPELGATGRAAGKKGVLHTIWAKKRLRVLQKEIEHEMAINAEGVALHMAVQEKEWIEGNFGLSPHGQEGPINAHDPSTSASVYPTGPATPVSPVSGRKLAEKLKGLKLRTGEKELSANSGSDPAHLLSPQSPDVAVSSFSSFRSVANRAPYSMLTPDTHAVPTTKLQSIHTGSETLRPFALHPPEPVQEAQQFTGLGGFAAISTVTTLAHPSSADNGDDLFAKALSPRSPDLPRSPFSFA